MSDWQPISTPPNDGQSVLVKFEDGQSATAYMVGEYWSDEGGYWCFVDLKANEMSTGGYLPVEWAVIQ